MPNRFAGRHDMSLPSMGLGGNRPGDAQRRRRAADARRWAEMVPIAGGLLGGAAGTAIGAAAGDPLAGAGIGFKLGSQAGGAMGQSLSSDADEMEDPMRMREYKRRALLEAIRGAR